MKMDREWVEIIRKAYPKGCTVVVDEMKDIQAVPPGTKGRVTVVDDVGTIHVAWETGSSLGLVPGEDKFHRVTV